MSREEYREIKIKIKKILKRKGLTVNELANRLNLNPRFFAELSCIKLDRLKVMCKAIDVSIFDVLEDENFKKLYNDKGELIKIERI